MTDHRPMDALEDLAAVADDPEAPDPAFTESLLEELVGELDPEHRLGAPVVPFEVEPERRSLPRTPPRSGRGRARPALVVAAAALLIVVGGLIARDRDDAMVASTGQTPVDVAAAEQFVDAFLSADTEALEDTLADVWPWQSVQIVFFQRWSAAGGTTLVERRPCQASRSDGIVTCQLVMDNFVERTLDLDQPGTDTFILEVVDGRIRTVKFNDDAPQPVSRLSRSEVGQRGMVWVREYHPELFLDGGPCEGFLYDGPTPGECALAHIEVLREFVASDQFPTD